MFSREFCEIFKNTFFHPSKHSSWWRRLEHVLNTSFVYVFRRRLQDVFKTSSSRRIYLPYSYIFRRRLQDFLIKTNILVLVIRLQDVFKTSSRLLHQDEYIRLSHTSSEDAFKTSSRRFAKTSSRRFQNVFKTSSRHLQDVFKTSSGHLQDVFKTFWRRLQDVCKTYHQVKLFLLTRFQDVFEIYSKRFWDVLQRRLSIEGFA